MEKVEALDMKTRVFADDGQPESWDCNDNYYDLDEIDVQEQLLHWARASAKRKARESASRKAPAAFMTLEGSTETN